MLTGNARHENVPPPLNLNRVLSCLKSCLKWNDRNKLHHVR